MSYISESEIRKLEERYGKPLEFQAEFAMKPDEFLFVKSTQKDGRAHDVTLFIMHDGLFLFIAKHFYPRGLYRAPSGAAKPGESIEDGAKREALEETGASIELTKFLAKIKVRFINSGSTNECIDWKSFVFLARYISGEIDPRDKREIREAKFIDPGDIPGFNEVMRKSSIGGFHYRAFLTEKVMEIIDRGGFKLAGKRS
jgi:8-oxo-dGTP pyrophosphatase MutT (NUDIX family)